VGTRALDCPHREKRNGEETEWGNGPLQGISVVGNRKSTASVKIPWSRTGVLRIRREEETEKKIGKYWILSNQASLGAVDFFFRGRSRKKNNN